MAPGTALVQKRLGGDGITIVASGEAGNGGGRFRVVSNLVHPAGQRASPVLIIVENNGWGISTEACSQHGERHVIDRG